MIRLDRCFCPTCGKEHDGSGRLGTSRQCSCGAWMPRKGLDRVRYYWIFQAAMSYGGAAFFLALALFYRYLPNDPWDRLFNPILQVPTISTFIVSYRVFVQHKLRYDDDNVFFRYFLWGVGLMTVGLAVASLVAILAKYQ